MTDLQAAAACDFKGVVAWRVSHAATCSVRAAAGRRPFCTSLLREQFAAFFADTSKFALGACNGCQMCAALKDIIPGAQGWPSFERNASEQYEARLVTVEIVESPSILLRDMSGSRIPIAVAHGEGRALFAASGDVRKAGVRALRRQRGAFHRTTPG